MSIQSFVRHYCGVKALIMKTSLVAPDSRPTVLVVDDEAGVVTLVSRILASQGYELLTAMSGGRALEIGTSSGRVIDLLLSDLHMPDMTGRELATRLRAVQPGMKVLYFTGGCCGVSDGLTALKPHEAFIQKPITIAGLREAVSLHLGSKIAA
jgi:two-component system, cell cycle sensor histidine kinase and response regulator CckA